MSRNSIAVIGAGPAGMMAAITAAREGCKVVLYEQNDRLGKKLLATGNGKCNLGNSKLSQEHYHGSSREFIEAGLKGFGKEDTRSFFRGLGMLIKEKNGYWYPVSEQASTVLDVLRFELQALGVVFKTGYKVASVLKTKDGRHITVTCGQDEMQSMDSINYDKVILACGSKAAPKTGSDGSGYRLASALGHKIVPVVPALVQLRCKENHCKAIAGVRAEARIKVLGRKGEIACESGEIQFTDYGISGIPVFQLSRTVNYELPGEKELKVCMDFLPDFTKEAYEKMGKERYEAKGEKTIEEFFTGILHKKLMLLMIKQAGLKTNMLVKEADKKKVMEVFRLCRNFTLHIIGSNSYEQAQVCAGGVDTKEVTDKMESRKVSGIYFAGEILDVDGRCGGYNLQWAWSSGFLAGKSAAEGQRKGMEDSYDSN